MMQRRDRTENGTEMADATPPSPGSSALTPEQQDWYLERYGVRYHAVQEQPFRPSRRVRRGRGTAQDIALLDGQRAAWQALARMNIRPAPEPT